MKTETFTAAVETEIICSADGKNSYEIVKRLKGVEGDKGIIISLYPTRTKKNLFGEDSTLNHLVSHMQDMDLNELRMINLFSKVTEGKFSSKGLVIDVDNIRYIESIFNSKDFQDYKFIIAWGNSLTSSYACQKSKYEILKMLKNTAPDTTVYQINFAGSEDIGVDFAHPLFLGIRGRQNQKRKALAGNHRG